MEILEIRPTILDETATFLRNTPRRSLELVLLALFFFSRAERRSRSRLLVVVRNPTKNRGETPGRRERERERGTPVTVRYHQLFRVRYLEGNEARAVFVPTLSVGSRGGRGSLDKISMNISQRTSLPARKYNTTPSWRVEGASHDRVPLSRLIPCRASGFSYR